MSRRSKRLSGKHVDQQSHAGVRDNGLSDPRRTPGSVSGPGGAHDVGMVVVDATNVVLMGSVECCLINTVSNGLTQQHRVYLLLGGRINHTDEVSRTGFIFDLDGAAAIITQLLALCDRAGPGAMLEITQRLAELHREGNVDLTMLLSAIGAAASDVGA